MSLKALSTPALKLNLKMSPLLIVKHSAHEKMTAGDVFISLTFQVKGVQLGNVNIVKNCLVQ